MRSAGLFRCARLRAIVTWASLLPPSDAAETSRIPPENAEAPFGRFPLTTFLLGTGLVAFVIAEWLARWRYRLQHEAHERRLASALVREWGCDTLAPFALRADKSYFFSGDRTAFLAYRVVGVCTADSRRPAHCSASHRCLQCFKSQSREIWCGHLRRSSQHRARARNAIREHPRTEPAKRRLEKVVGFVP